MDRSLLNKATSSDDTPTPGYVLQEIAKLTFADVNAPQQLADYLIKKLERDDPKVKAKCLKVIRHVCEQGKPDFRRAVQKRSDVVKSCLQYRGNPDPLLGDAPNKAVRDEADAAVKSLFSSDSATNAYGMTMDQAKKMQGFGSDTANEAFPSNRTGGFSSSSFGGGACGGNSYSSDPGYGGAGSGAKSFSSGGMVGFGNPNFNNEAPRHDEKETIFKKAMSTTLSAVSGTVSTITSKVKGTPLPFPNGPANMSGGPNTSTYRAPSVAGGDNNFGGCGGGYNGGGGGFGGNGNAYGGGGGSYGGGGPWGQSSANQRSSPPVASSSGEYEARVVGELCAPGGPRVAPSAAALEEFCKKCESLNANSVGHQLRQKLEESDWQTRLKALCAIEALHNAGLDAIVGHVSEFSSDILFQAQEMPQCRQKAGKVLHLLGFIDQPDDKPMLKGSSQPAASAASTQASPAFDLLDMDDVRSQAASAASATKHFSGAMDLLESGSSHAPAPNPLGPVDILDFGCGSSASGCCGGSGGVGGGGLFGDLNVCNPTAEQNLRQPEQTSLLAAVSGGAMTSQSNDVHGLFQNLQQQQQCSGAAPGQPMQAQLLMMQQQQQFVQAQQMIQQQQIGHHQPNFLQSQGLPDNRTAHLNVLASCGGTGAMGVAVPMSGIGPMGGMGSMGGMCGIGTGPCMGIGMAHGGFDQHQPGMTYAGQMGMAAAAPGYGGGMCSMGLPSGQASVAACGKSSGAPSASNSAFGFVSSTSNLADCARSNGFQQVAGQPPAQTDAAFNFVMDAMKAA